MPALSFAKSPSLRCSHYSYPRHCCPLFAASARRHCPSHICTAALSSSYVYWQRHSISPPCYRSPACSIETSLTVILDVLNSAHTPNCPQHSSREPGSTLVLASDKIWRVPSISLRLAPKALCFSMFLILVTAAKLSVLNSL